MKDATVPFPARLVALWEGVTTMIKAIMAAGCAAIAVTAAPAAARHYTNKIECSRWHNHRCVSWHRMTRAEARRAAEYRVGYNFGRGYDYAVVRALPRPVVSRYHLRNNFRYVNQNGYVYVVNPNTYRVVRVIPTL